MAKQNPASDPVSQAMLAIEDALNLGVDPEAVEPEAQKSEPAPPPPAAEPAPNLKAPAPSPKPAEPLLPLSAPAKPQRETAKPQRETKTTLPGEPSPANDDRASVRPIVQALQAPQPSRAPFVAATLLSLLWLVACGYFAFTKYAAGGLGKRC